MEATRVCRVCGDAKPLDKDNFQWLRSESQFRTICKQCSNERQVAWRAQDRARGRKYSADDYVKHREKRLAASLARAAGNREVNRAYNRQWRADLKAEMQAAYGGRCACCDEREPAFLTLEHARRDGNVHRKALGGQMQVYCELKRRGWPTEGYELLCWNCQMATSRGAVCPHKLRAFTRTAA